MKTVLLIEDDSSIAQLYEIVFAKKNYTVELAFDGEEGLIKAKELKPDIILLDVMLPKLTGLQVIKVLKEDPDLQKIPVFAVTNLADPKVEESMRQAGAIEYLIKSQYFPDQIVEFVDTYFSAHTEATEKQTSLTNTQDLHKAGGLLIQDRKFMLEKHGGKEIYIIPGGKLEEGETAQKALIRELQEEFAILVKEEDLETLESFSSPAVHTPDKIVRIDTFLVKKWSGEITLHDGIEGVTWVNSTTINEISVSEIAKQHVLPMLLKMNLID